MSMLADATLMVSFWAVMVKPNWTTVSGAAVEGTFMIKATNCGCSGRTKTDSLCAHWYWTSQPEGSIVVSSIKSNTSVASPRLVICTSNEHEYVGGQLGFVGGVTMLGMRSALTRNCTGRVVFTFGYCCDITSIDICWYPMLALRSGISMRLN